MSYEKYLVEHLRITILRLLLEQTDYTLNESLIADMSTEYGFSPSRDRVRNELYWLREQGLVELREPSGLAVATLTERGADVAAGRALAPGIKRPSPGR
ncbi:hypothetical protein [Desulfocurvus vexinensis]|uniref:VpaChn25_0724 family phage protein n=1 Tax=Desulfocurvus vexinensis TaxID=399548 RepID=UPI00048BA6C2|nr:hypothetical protein [Desulfocurvus vexinensis]